MRTAAVPADSLPFHHSPGHLARADDRFLISERVFFQQDQFTCSLKLQPVVFSQEMNFIVPSLNFFLILLL